MEIISQFPYDVLFCFGWPTITGLPLDHPPSTTAFPAVPSEAEGSKLPNHSPNTPLTLPTPGQLYGINSKRAFPPSSSSTNGPGIIPKYLLEPLRTSSTPGVCLGIQMHVLSHPWARGIPETVLPRTAPTFSASTRRRVRQEDPVDLQGAYTARCIFRMPFLQYSGKGRPAGESNYVSLVHTAWYAC